MVTRPIGSNATLCCQDGREVPYQLFRCDTEHNGTIARDALRERPRGNIAYQVVGGGPVDLVIVPGWLSHVDLMWGDPAWAKFVGELSSFAQ